MEKENRVYFEIKDACRGKLAVHTRKAFRMLPSVSKPAILDMGCGTGVPAMEMVVMCNGTVTAVDPDPESLAWFREKVKTGGYDDKVTIVDGTVQSAGLPEGAFDIVLAEGLLNIIGFEEGLRQIDRYSRPGAYAIIHDELPGRDEKLALFKKYGFHLLFSFVLDEKTWWESYYGCLEKSIREWEAGSAAAEGGPDLFCREKSEIEDYRRDPGRFSSVFYIIQKK